ncbi:peptide/nickel transport system permease protein [Pseudonocardia autotrophica]|uniref:Glutathione transport system permease protein GsiC n=1 Tax=Pseudonocardia autotrophica TaxID=2074 RepID=A0A1Y2N9E3_PSEAH|nr:Glutathione transport system permease protein GsiC [Pseudonocardia autotrophica]TDN74180.1 peptide/nickel transport system permease protein [Pseudonocardia autotrophica]BBG04940.1 metal transporter [Pseudonocardia autotrophica]
MAPAGRSAPAWRRAVRRIGVAGVALGVASVLVFALTALLPGETAEIVLGPDATDEQVQRLRAELGTDRPAVERFAGWAAGLVRGDLGNSLVTGRPVLEELTHRLGATVLLGGTALLVTVPLAVGIGVLAGRRPGRPVDRVSTGVVAALQAAPEFALGLLLVGLFSLQLGWLPATAGGGSLLTPAVLVLPVAVLVVSQLGRLSRQVRLGVVQADRSPHVTHLRRLGLTERVVLTRHVLPGGIAPALQQLARVSDGMLSGVVVVEALFALPGVGAGFVRAVQLRDVPLVQGYALLFAATTIVVNLMVDLVSARLTPVREENP